ncbi:MAG: uracil-DNA glycosylase [Gammaproteobacteria bacterium]
METGRADYLYELGIPVWVRRDQPAEDAHAEFGEEPRARAEAIATMDWEALTAAVRDCTACRLRAGCARTVFGVGDRHAQWMLVGEAPGAEEDRQGEPFVGRAGQLLNAMLTAIGLRREAVYITNVVKCRPPGNRDPAPDEAVTCRPFLERQIELVQPKLILALGRVAAQNLLGTQAPLARLRGHAHELRGIPVVVTYHPAYLLRTPSEKRKAWADLQFAARIVQGVPQ